VKGKLNKNIFIDWENGKNMLIKDFPLARKKTLQLSKIKATPTLNFEK